MDIAAKMVCILKEQCHERIHPSSQEGLDHCWLEDSLNPDSFICISLKSLPAACSPPHTHTGAGFYVLEGSGVVETENGPIGCSRQSVIWMPAACTAWSTRAAGR
jgi:quercetin dioxygenase-like cupin family protein